MLSPDSSLFSKFSFILDEKIPNVVKLNCDLLKIKLLFMDYFDISIR